MLAPTSHSVFSPLGEITCLLYLARVIKQSKGADSTMYKHKTKRGGAGTRIVSDIRLFLIGLTLLSLTDTVKTCKCNVFKR